MNEQDAEIARLSEALSACQQDRDALRAPLEVVFAAKEMEAQCDEMNFPDRSDYGRFWSRWLDQARAALLRPAQSHGQPPSVDAVDPADGIVEG